MIALAVFVSGCSYNKFTRQEEAIKGAWAEVKNQLQRRNDLIANLVETVKGFAMQEREIFTHIADSRSKLAGATTPADDRGGQPAVLGTRPTLVIVENYPHLKSDAPFQRLMDELAGTENRIAVARGRYNEQMRDYNTLRRQFPSNVTAKVFGFQEYPYFEVPADARKAPKVDFSR